MSNYKAVVFDIDGTLVSTNKLIFASFNHVTNKYLGKEYSQEEIVALFGPTENVILKEWMKDKYDSACKDYYAFYSENHDSMTHHIEGLKEFIEELRNKDLHLGVFTGKGRDSSMITLEKLGISEYFDIVVTGDDVETFKPSPEGLNKIISNFNLKPDEVLMIGDAPSDVQAARDAGCKCVSVVWDGHPIYDPEELESDFCVSTVEELRNIILK